MKSTVFFLTNIVLFVAVSWLLGDDMAEKRKFNGPYNGEYLNRVAFPIGGIGAGMICLEGTGAVSHVSVRNEPNVDKEPLTFAAICIKGKDKNTAKVLEGPVPEWKYFGKPRSGNGLEGSSFGLPRFEKAEFLARFPFADIKLEDPEVNLGVQITGWSPFIPGDADNSGLPAGALEYHFKNTSSETCEAVFSFHSQNFMRISLPDVWEKSFKPGYFVKPIHQGFLLWQDGEPEHPEDEGGFVFATDEENVKVNHYWFRGGSYDALTMAWKSVEKGEIIENPPVDETVAGASFYVPFTLAPNEEKTIKVMLCWYVPHTTLRRGNFIDPPATPESKTCCASTHVPYYAAKFKNIYELSDYWRNNYNKLHQESKLFSKVFYSSTLAPEVMEAIAANLTILKSPTVLRQADGRLWAWEGCHNQKGCCPGSCTHVWNYAQAIPHLFPSLERTLRETEFYISQNEQGHQQFRSGLPIDYIKHTYHAASDGQLGGIMKVYREWRISGDTNWLEKIWPPMQKSMQYCIETWDPDHKGIVEEPHHNTYDIEFWGPDGMCTSFYLGALTAIIEMGGTLNKDISLYTSLLEKGKKYMETGLYNGKYFIQQIKWKELKATAPSDKDQEWKRGYSPEALEILEKEGPKYQYGNGCLSDGVLGLWIARVCGLDQEILDKTKVQSHLTSIHKYNLVKDLFDHANPQRPSYALGHEGGLLLCTWPEKDEPSLPFIYSNEVWTGIEYQVASHLMFEGYVKEGLEIVRTCRARYDGRVRNPFDEYECGHWYARAMSSYGMLQALTGIRYDAVDKTLYINSQIGDDFTVFLATASALGTAGLKNGQPFVQIYKGELDIEKCFVSGKEKPVSVSRL